MDAERSGAEMNDAALDRELRALLAVDPSPEFAARVRGRVAATPTYVGRGFSPAAVLVAAAAAVAMAVVLSRQPEAPPPTSFASHDIQLPPAVVAPTPVQANPDAVAVAARRVAAPPVPQPAASEIVIDPAETRALLRLIRATRDGSLDLSAAVRATPPSAMDVPAIDPIVIPPLTIDPLNLNGPTAEEGVRP
jgi:hypothetical protein